MNPFDSYMPNKVRRPEFERSFVRGEIADGQHPQARMGVEGGVRDLRGCGDVETVAERFFRNLLLNETHELKSRYLLIGLSSGDPCGFKMSSDRTPKGGKKKAVGKGGQKRWSEKGGQKTRDRLIRLLDADPHLSREGLSAALGICPSAVQKHLAKLKKDNRLRRIGPDKGGHWEVVAP